MLANPEYKDDEVERGEEIKEELVKAGFSETGKIPLFDGRTGQKFEQDVAVGGGSSGRVSRAERPEVAVSGYGAAEAEEGKIVNVEAVGDNGRCENCGKVNKRNTKDHFICLCTLVSSEEKDRRPMGGEFGVRGSGVNEPRNSNITFGRVGKESMSKRQKRNRLRLEKFLLKKAEAGCGGQESKE
jgi:hypothetical protein